MLFGNFLDGSRDGYKKRTEFCWRTVKLYIEKLLVSRPGIHGPKNEIFEKPELGEIFLITVHGSLVQAMSLYEIETILNQYSFEFDRSLDKKDKLRRLKCDFCNCLFKYQVCLNHHVNAKHMVDLKELSNLERMSFIRLYFEDDRDISYGQFHKEYFIQKKNLSLMNC